MCKIFKWVLDTFEVKCKFRYQYFVCIMSVSGVKVEWKSHSAPNLAILLILNTEICVLMSKMLFLKATWFIFKNLIVPVGWIWAVIVM